MEFGKERNDIRKILEEGPFLRVGEMYFLCTTKERRYIEERKKEIEKEYPKARLRIAPYGVQIIEHRKKTNEVQEWGPDEGYSLWASR